MDAPLLATAGGRTVNACRLNGVEGEVFQNVLGPVPVDLVEYVLQQRVEGHWSGLLGFGRCRARAGGLCRVAGLVGEPELCRSALVSKCPNRTSGPPVGCRVKSKSMRCSVLNGTRHLPPVKPPTSRASALR